MTASIIELKASLEDRRIAALAAAGIGLTLAEAAIPLPIPGIKPGLANIVTLLVLYRYGWRLAAWVSLLRIVAGALFLGTFLTPTFALSLAGGLASLAVLALAARLPPAWFGPVGLSLLAAFGHIGTQLLLVDVWLMPGVSLIGLLPLFLGAAWLTGLINGLIVARMMPMSPIEYRRESTA
ncbi:heptaprenyl diphosphate synthase [Sulfuritortus calidifontis]|uniref:Heptaprenyl diphosphate synthase n=1 Tax=Sulfuritortus calidifontis TaxID=1914471 RepID=A0A4R3JT57_9PROT|nr:Gx transporter family protein [Sulfuritortus calidifontis]TCS70455.1 heptaprenyl diphosphate synthase [Sulfuritortus calidifontis]